MVGRKTGHGYWGATNRVSQCCRALPQRQPGLWSVTPASTRDVECYSSVIQGCGVLPPASTRDVECYPSVNQGCGVLPPHQSGPRSVTLESAGAIECYPSVSWGHECYPRVSRGALPQCLLGPWNVSAVTPEEAGAERGFSHPLAHLSFHNWAFLPLWCFPRTTFWEHSSTTKFLPPLGLCCPAVLPATAEGKVDGFGIVSGTVPLVAVFGL